MQFFLIRRLLSPSEVCPLNGMPSLFFAAPFWRMLSASEKSKRWDTKRKPRRICSSAV